MTFKFKSQDVNAILLDIEGTVAPIDFVAGILFPFAKKHLRTFLTNHQNDPDVGQDLDLLFADYQQDCRSGLPVPIWDRTNLTMAIEYIHYLIDCDRKSTGLKSLQGKIWHQGYSTGELKSQLFSDTKPAFERWVTAKKRVYIFSSGSIQAQKLLFQHTEVGDLTPYISGYFDTRTGPKKESDSYQAIAVKIGTNCPNILFISDVEAELDAAQTAGMQTLLSLRPGNQNINSSQFVTIRTFDQVL